MYVCMYICMYVCMYVSAFPAYQLCCFSVACLHFQYLPFAHLPPLPVWFGWQNVDFGQLLHWILNFHILCALRIINIYAYNYSYCCNYVYIVDMHIWIQIFYIRYFHISIHTYIRVCTSVYFFDFLTFYDFGFIASRLTIQLVSLSIEWFTPNMHVKIVLMNKKNASMWVCIKSVATQFLISSKMLRKWNLRRIQQFLGW